MLPSTQNTQVFQTRLRPYVTSSSVFYCPDTGLPYTPNAAISGKSFSSFSGDYDTIEVAQDSQPHADGLYTVLYLDGTVQHGGQTVGDPNDIVVSRAKSLALAVTQYTQDNDEILPPMHTPEEFHAALAPYTYSQAIFYAPNGKPFLPNADLSGVSLVSIANPHSTLLLADQEPYVNGVQTRAYVDGSVQHGVQSAIDPNSVVVSRAKQLALATTQYTQDYDEFLPPMHTPEEFQSALAPYVSSSAIFYAPNGKPFLPNTDLSGVNIANIAEPYSTVLLTDQPPYVSGAPTVAYLDGHVVHNPVFTSRLLWTNTNGRASVWNLSDANPSATCQLYGPYPGWTARAIAEGSDGSPRLLWTSTTGQASLWNLADANPAATCHLYGPFGGWTAKALAVGPDNLPHLLWNNTSGQISLWNVDSAGGFTYTYAGPYSGWSGTAISYGGDGQERLLWNNVNGQASLWNLGDQNPVASCYLYGPYAGWTAKALAVGPDNVPHLLWNNTNGQASLWNVDSAGGFAFTYAGPYAGWSGTAIGVGGDNRERVLWNNRNGQVSVWNLSDADPAASSLIYGPYGGWSAVGISASR